MYDAVAMETRGEDRSAAHDLRSRQLNNLIKAHLISRYASSGRVADLACGRGGDLAKYLTHAPARGGGLTHYTGMDVSAKAISEARLRWAAAAAAASGGSGGGPGVDVRFVVADVACLEPGAFPAGSLNSVSCMFALHYFAQSAAHMTRLISNIGTWLAPGGHFIGVLPDASALMDYSAEAMFNGDTRWTHPLCSVRYSDAIFATLRRRAVAAEDARAAQDGGGGGGEESASWWGQGYSFDMASGLVRDSQEWLVPMQGLVAVAAKHGGMQLVESEPLQRYMELRAPPAELQASMHCSPDQMRRVDWTLSNLYCTFVFKKL
jgi:SAM-dependent methyltransferase